MLITTPLSPSPSFSTSVWYNWSPRSSPNGAPQRNWGASPCPPFPHWRRSLWNFPRPYQIAWLLNPSPDYAIRSFPPSWQRLDGAWLVLRSIATHYRKSACPSQQNIPNPEFLWFWQLGGGSGSGYGDGWQWLQLRRQ